MVKDTGHRWALMLAAGEGSRLRGLTTTQEGISIPKQFCSLQGGPSLLQETLHRAEVIASRQRICAIVAAQHRHWWEGPLWPLPASNAIVQPANRGTANGILLPLLHILERDPEAQVVLLPCDHHVRDEATLSESMRFALAQLNSHADEVLLLGIEPEEPDPELGYIVPEYRDDGAERSGISRVAKFVEKPPAAIARQLIDHGGLWNAFIVVSTAQALLRLFETRVPELLMEMRCVVQRGISHRADSTSLTELYARLPELDFSRHIAAGQEGRLRVLKVPACGWSDLGTPKRVAETLFRTSPHSERPKIATHSNTVHLNLAAQYARLQSMTELTA